MVSGSDQLVKYGWKCCSGMFLASIHLSASHDETLHFPVYFELVAGDEDDGSEKSWILCSSLRKYELQVN